MKVVDQRSMSHLLKRILKCANINLKNNKADVHYIHETYSFGSLEVKVNVTVIKK